MHVNLIRLVHFPICPVVHSKNKSLLVVISMACRGSRLLVCFQYVTTTGKFHLVVPLESIGQLADNQKYFRDAEVVRQHVLPVSRESLKFSFLQVPHVGYNSPNTTDFRVSCPILRR